MATQAGRSNKAYIGNFAALVFLVFVWATCRAEGAIVRADDYRTFWLWAGVKTQPVLDQADEVYVLAGEVSDDQRPRIISQRSAVPQIKVAKVWIVYRAQTMRWNGDIIVEILRQIDVWKSKGNDLAGLQIDFDAGTKNLERYAEFLMKVRADLPRDYRLSVTGLLDWSANGDPAGLEALGGVVDEVVLQIYQGRKVIPGYQTYLRKLDRLKVPFRIGLLQGGEWRAPSNMNDNAFFRGYVVFLVNGAR